MANHDFSVAFAWEMTPHHRPKQTSFKLKNVASVIKTALSFFMLKEL